MTPTPAPMTAARLKHIKGTFERWGEAALERACRELIAHIDALTARIAELERDREAFNRGQLYQCERAGRAESALAAARKPPEDGEVVEALDLLGRDLFSGDAEKVVADVGFVAGVITRQAAALKEAERAVSGWMIANGYATGHGDTVADMIGELDWQIKERREKGEKI